MYIDKETGKVIEFCCDDMECQWGNEKEYINLLNKEKLPDINKEQMAFFYYDTVAKEVFLRLPEWLKDFEGKFFLGESFYSTTACLFCKEPIEIIDKKELPSNKNPTEYGKVFDYILTHKDVYPSEISDSLGINYELVWKILKELQIKGKIETGE